MKNKKLLIVSLQTLVQNFFEKYLTVERNVKRNTVLSYRDCLKLLLDYASEHFKCNVDQLDHEVLDVDVVRSFLGWLETERKCGPRTRNQRLAVIKSFVRYVASVAPEHLERCRRIREMRPANIEHPEVEYLEDDEILTLIEAIDPVTGCRNRALLLLLYNTGARVQEIVDLNVTDFISDPVAQITLQGKGRKQRTLPLWQRTVDAVNAMLEERNADDGPLFLNAHGRRLSRSGIAYILRTLAKKADLSPRHARHVTPHVIRHTTAMHHLQSDNDITTIAAWLGHSQLATTHAYIEITLRMKQKAVAATDTLPELSVGTYPKGDLLTWLASLGRSHSYAQKPPPPPSSFFSRGSPLHITGRST